MVTLSVHLVSIFGNILKRINGIRRRKQERVKGLNRVGQQQHHEQLDTSEVGLLGLLKVTKSY